MKECIKKLNKGQQKKLEKKLARKALKEWGVAVRSKGHCEKCLSTDCKLDAHHLISRTFKPLITDLRNGCCLCSGCHLFGQESAHKGSIMFLEWFRTYRPEDYKYVLEKFKYELTNIPK